MGKILYLENPLDTENLGKRLIDSLGIENILVAHTVPEALRIAEGNSYSAAIFGEAIEEGVTSEELKSARNLYNKALRISQDGIKGVVSLDFLELKRLAHKYNFHPPERAEQRFHRKIDFSTSDTLEDSVAPGIDTMWYVDAENPCFEESGQNIKYIGAHKSVPDIIDWAKKAAA